MELSYHRFGNGNPIVILHGLYGMSDNWISIGKKLSVKNEVFLVDLRNHGRSPKDSSHTYADMVRDLLVFFSHHSIQNAVLIGHSMGGKTAMSFTQKHFDLVKKLIVIDIAPKRYDFKNPNLPNSHEKILATLSSINLNNYNSRQEISDAIKEDIPSLILRQFLLKNLHREKSGQYNWKINIPILQIYMEEISNGVDADLENLCIAVPTIFIQGALSNYITKNDNEMIQNHFSNYKIIPIPNAGHWVHAEQPDLVINAISEFIL